VLYLVLAFYFLHRKKGVSALDLISILRQSLLILDLYYSNTTVTTMPFEVTNEIVTSPAVTLVATPDEVTVALEVLEEVHTPVGVISTPY